MQILDRKEHKTQPTTCYKHACYSYWQQQNLHACWWIDDPSDLLASIADGFRGAQARGEDSDGEEQKQQCSGTRHRSILRVGSFFFFKEIVLEAWCSAAAHIYACASATRGWGQAGSRASACSAHCLLRSLVQETTQGLSVQLSALSGSKPYFPRNKFNWTSKYW